MEYFVISAKFVPLKYYTLSSQLHRLASFSVGCSGRRILSPGQINIMRKWSIARHSLFENSFAEFLDEVWVKINQDFVQSLVAFRYSNIF